MSLDIQSEALISFADAAARLPSRPNLSTLHRWRLKGVRGVRLESCLLGGKRYTSLEALQRFTDRTSAAGNSGATAPSQERRIQQAEEELRREGL